MEKILVGSVLVDNCRVKSLYDLQMRFLKKTTRKFEHVVCTNSPASFLDSNVIRDNLDASSDYFIGSKSHASGLNILLDAFRSSDSDYFLILDSDCFPIENDWLNLLLSKMKDFSVSAPVRFENLEQHAHPCAFFFKRRALDDMKFEVAELNSITGEVFYDTCSNIDAFFPLVRTNKFNLHPVFFGIYCNIFYHHGAGSRYGIGETRFRSRDLGYYGKESALSDEDNHRLFKNLLLNPISFIMKLKGIPIC